MNKKNAETTEAANARYHRLWSESTNEAIYLPGDNSSHPSHQFGVGTKVNPKPTTPRGKRRNSVSR